MWQKIFEGEKFLQIAGKYDFHGRSVLPLIGVGSNSILGAPNVIYTMIAAICAAPTNINKSPG